MHEHDMRKKNTGILIFLSEEIIEDLKNSLKL